MTPVVGDGPIVVLGAGIVGAACARALALDGRDVVLVDSRPVGSGSTAAGMGHIVVMDDSDAQFALCRRSRELWERLAPTFPSVVEYDHAGTLWVAADDEEMAEVHRKMAYYEARSYEAEVLDGTSIYRWEPNLRPGLAGGLRVPGDRVMYPPAAAQALIDGVRGIRVVIGKRCVGLESGRVSLVDGVGGRVETMKAGHVVLAAGYQSVAFVPGLDIRPRKGHLVITDRYPGFVKHQMIELGYLKSAHGHDNESVAFNVQPRPTGQLLIGSSRQFGTEDPRVEPHMIRRMLARAFEYVPGLAGLSALRAWTGFRAATPDSLPFIGVHPTLPFVSVAAGHEGLGITTSLATAELIADALAGRPSAIDPTPYLPGRAMKEAGHG